MSSYMFWGIFKQHVSSFNYEKIRTTGAVLVAISIPIFTSQLEKSRDAVTIANLRSAYAEASAAALTGSSDDANVIVDNAFKDGVGKIRVADVAIKSTDADYGNGATELPFTVTAVAGVANKTATVEFDFPSNGGKPTAIHYN